LEKLASQYLEVLEFYEVVLLCSFSVVTATATSALTRSAYNSGEGDSEREREGEINKYLSF